MLPIFRYRGKQVYFVYSLHRIEKAYAVYVGAHGVAGAICGAGGAIYTSVKENDMSYCILAPLSAFTCGLFGVGAGLIPGVTPIAAVAIMCKKLMNT